MAIWASGEENYLIGGTIDLDNSYMEIEGYANIMGETVVDIDMDIRNMTALKNMPSSRMTLKRFRLMAISLRLSSWGTMASFRPAYPLLRVPMIPFNGPLPFSSLLKTHHFLYAWMPANRTIRQRTAATYHDQWASPSDW